LVHAVVAAALYQFGFMLMFFLVPLQVVAGSRGIKALSYGSGLTLAFLVAYRLVQVVRLDMSGPLQLMLWLDLLVPAVFIVTLFVMNIPRLQEYGIAWRMVLSGALAAGFTVPVILVVQNVPAFHEGLEMQMQLAREMIIQSSGNAEMISAVEWERFYRIGIAFMASSYVFWFVLMVTVNWFIGSVIVAMKTGMRGFLNIREFMAPEIFTWPVLISWAVMVLTLIRSFGVPTYIAWNMGLIGLFIYGIQGVAIILHLFDRFKLGRLTRNIIAVGVVFGFFVPGVNVAIMIGVPLLGISELWVQYHRPVRLMERE
jgi:hypothetical protein